MAKKFYAVVGNPPYQEQSVGDQKTFQKPLYDRFLDASYLVADRVEMVHPARFLFNSGSTPKSWNGKMLSDPHLKVLRYEADSRMIFPKQEIKGGIVVTYRDTTKEIGPIGVFTPFQELNSIMKKVAQCAEKPFESIVVSRTAYRLTEEMHRENPDALGRLSNGHPYDMSTNIFERLPYIFLDKRPVAGDYISILGRENNQRVVKWIKRTYVNEVSNLGSYKLFMSSANGSGKFGEALTPPWSVSQMKGLLKPLLALAALRIARTRRARKSMSVASSHALFWGY